MASDRRVSLATQEVNILRKQWDLLEEFVNGAKVHLNHHDYKAALEMCQKALACSSDYFPALELQKKITEAQNSMFSSSDCDSLSSLESDEDDELHSQNRRLADVGSTPAPKGFSRITFAQSSKMADPVAPKSCLKPSVTPSSSSSSSSVTFEGQENVEKKLTWRNQQDLQLTERKLKNILLEGVFMLIGPVELFNHLGGLWNKETGSFQCPHRGCTGKSSKRLKVAVHFLESHFSEHDGKLVMPFSCGTCKEKFRSHSQLLNHANSCHPTCRWADKLKEAISDAKE